MIRNEREYRITSAQARKFAEALARLKDAPPNPKLTPAHRKIQRDALASQLDVFQSDLKDYDRLKNGKRRSLRASSLDELAQVLIQARIALKLTQKDLAQRLGLKEQQIQRYEATGYGAASLARLIEVTTALGLQVAFDIPLPKPSPVEKVRRQSKVA